ncbi:MAG: hypothetical protein H6733_12160 [Alphaproteobacteria bacterium]|nr:hypothetical protein [Alphaproteobacteria bacterium]
MTPMRHLSVLMLAAAACTTGVPALELDTAPTAAEVADQAPPPILFDLEAPASAPPGSAVTLTVTLPQPRNGIPVHFILSRTGQGAGQCPPLLGGSCLDILPGYTYLGSGRSQGGVVTKTITVPASGLNEAWFQAVIYDISPAVLSDVAHVVIDVDECAAGTDTCSDDASCTNTVGSYTCDCDDGFTGDGITCTDVDECAESTHTCSADAACTNTPGAYTCDCDPGFVGDGLTCVDVDECAAGTDACSDDASCTNTVGSYTCDCDAGFDGDGITCTDVDECADGTDTCDPSATCTNVAGGFTCACPSGYADDGTGACVDVDECATGNVCGSHGTCGNTDGSYTCACDDGYASDGAACVDIDECADGTLTCGTDAHCVNTDGAALCDCDAGYFGDGETCIVEDACGDMDCGAGSCLQVGTVATCDCGSDFTGDHCDTPTRAPSPVTSLVLSMPGRIGIHWTPPADPVWDHAIVVRSTTGAVTDPSQGTTVFTGRAREAFDDDVTVGVSTTYTVFLANVDGGLSTPVSATVVPDWSILDFSASGDLTYDSVHPHAVVDAWGAGGGGGTYSVGGGGGFATSTGSLAPGETWRVQVGQPGVAGSTGGCDATDSYGCGGTSECNANGCNGSGGQMSGVRVVGADPLDPTSWIVMAGGGGGGAGGRTNGWAFGGGAGGGATGQRSGGQWGGFGGHDGVGGAAPSGCYTSGRAGGAFASGGRGADIGTASGLSGGAGGGGYGGGASGGSCYSGDGGYAGGGGGGGWAEGNDLVTRFTLVGNGRTPGGTDRGSYPTTSPGWGAGTMGTGGTGHVVVTRTVCPAGQTGAGCSVDVGRPAPVRDVVLTSGDVTLTWTPSVSPDVVGYEIRRAKAGVPLLPDDGEWVGDVDASTSTFTYDDVDGTWYYAVLPYDGAGNYGDGAGGKGQHCTTVCTFEDSRLFTAPAGATGIRVYAWGAGGGGGRNASSYSFRYVGRGAAGGFAAGSAPASGGEVFRAVVGGRGTTASAGGNNGVDAIGLGGWGNCNGQTEQTWNGSGGQMSGVVRGTSLSTDVNDWIVIAGGGGGGASYAFTGTSDAGPGGGTSGVRGSCATSNPSGSYGGGWPGHDGLGGAYIYGGYADGNPGADWSAGGHGGGSTENGSNRAFCGGGGGGGYGGGGAGANSAAASCGGGGGGGWAQGVDAWFAVGAGRTPPMMAHPAYPDSATPGWGGDVNSNGTDGYMMVVFE